MYAAGNGAASPPIPRSLPERLVGIGFRRGLAALEQRDASNWEFAWQEMAAAAGPDTATSLLAELSLWVRSVRKCAGRKIETLPAGCPGFCRDECLAISMIAASQQGACPGLRACAFALLQSNALCEPIETAGRFGGHLAEAGLLLSANSVCSGLAAISMHGGRPS
jgi:hypothetical protein